MAISSKIARGTAAKITARKAAAATASTIKTNNTYNYKYQQM